MARVRRTWMTGAIGLIACGMLQVLQPGFQSPTAALVVQVLGGFVYAASVLLFAIGPSRDASVVARRPLGVTALAVVALWPLAGTVIMGPLAPSIADAGAGASTVYAYLALLIPTGAGLIAAAQIARSGTVPGPWRWMPLWTLGAQVLAWVIPQAVFAGARPADVQSFVEIYLSISTLAALLGTLGLGIMALVAATQQRPTSVEVFRSLS